MRSLVTGFAALLLIAPQCAAADDLVILSAAAVRPALIQVPPLFEKASGHRVSVSFGNATFIANKVAAGEPVDIAILPPEQLAGLIGRGLLAEASRTNLGVVRLGIAARAGGALPAVATADEFKAALLAASSFGMPDPADGSTSSRHIVKVLEELGIADAMKPRIRLFPDGTQALAALAKGEIGLTVAPVTSIHIASGVRLAGPLPEALQLKTVYAAALTTRSAASGAANALLTMLRSPAVAAVFKDKGVDPP